MTTTIIDNEPEYWADGPPGVFVPLDEADALEAQLAALTAERDGLQEQLLAALTENVIAKDQLSQALSNGLNPYLKTERDTLLASTGHYAGALRSLRALVKRLSEIGPEIFDNWDEVEGWKSERLAGLLADCQTILDTGETK